MIEDSLDGPGRLVIGTIQEGHEPESAGSPPVYPVAGLGEIGRHERMDDGNFNIWLVGLKRILINEIDSDRPYRQVDYTQAHEIDVPPPQEPPLREEVNAAILERIPGSTAPPDQLPLTRLVDFLILRMPLPHEVVQKLYSELDLQERARLALTEHATRPKLEE